MFSSTSSPLEFLNFSDYEILCNDTLIVICKMRQRGSIGYLIESWQEMEAQGLMMLKMGAAGFVSVGRHPNALQRANPAIFKGVAEFGDKRCDHHFDVPKLF